MQYYVIEWDREEEDEPWRLYLELDSRGSLRRKVEVYRIGLYQPFDDLDTPPVDPRQLAGSEGQRHPADPGPVCGHLGAEPGDARRLHGDVLLTSKKTGGEILRRFFYCPTYSFICPVIYRLP